MDNSNGLIISGRKDDVVPLGKLVKFLNDYSRTLCVMDIAHNVPEDAFKKGVMQCFYLNINKAIEADKIKK